MHIPGGIIKVTQTWRRKTFKNTVQVFHHEKVGERDEKKTTWPLRKKKHADMLIYTFQ